MKHNVTKIDQLPLSGSRLNFEIIQAEPWEKEQDDLHRTGMKCIMRLTDPNGIFTPTTMQINVFDPIDTHAQSHNDFGAAYAHATKQYVYTEEDVIGCKGQAWYEREKAWNGHVYNHLKHYHFSYCPVNELEHAGEEVNE
ncbi:hypothetical protein [Lacticaseibacillus absianus]|uniref:hypothetical protein n=1 Tax=Lacticaseibacillus absianus TaxID=2729623 RepID=UPI0015CBE380|nr:hypothetical protein [Lacticaseibacillus absianus]